MHALISSAMAVWLAVLSVTGWCCHSPSQSARNSPKAKPAACCKHCSHQSGEKGAPAPRESQPKCHGVCIYLPVEKSHVDRSQHLAPFDFTLDQTSVGMQVSVDAFSDEFRDPITAQPHLRLHLLHQIMLI
jgi:hypothetical protein